MKEYTNIRHNRPKTTERCERNLDKEPWGEGYVNMTCWKCGFVEIIPEETFLKWQYCDEVLYPIKG